MVDTPVSSVTATPTTTPPNASRTTVELALRRLRLTLGTDLRGRQVSDTLFAFDLSGVTSIASTSLLRSVARILCGSGGYPLLQSNCEDVFVAMRDVVLYAGLSSVGARHPMRNLCGDEEGLTLRSQK